MLMNMVMNMFDVWSAWLGHSRPLRLTNYAPKSQTNLPANFYPSNNTLIQALLVLLITNMISMGKTWSDLLKLCAASSSSPPLSKLSLLPGTRIGPQKVIFGHFAFFWYFYLIFPWARAIFFKCNPPHQNKLFLGQTFFPWLSNV